MKLNWLNFDSSKNNKIFRGNPLYTIFSININKIKDFADVFIKDDFNLLSWK